MKNIRKRKKKPSWDRCGADAAVDLSLIHQGKEAIAYMLDVVQRLERHVENNRDEHDRSAYRKLYFNFSETVKRESREFMSLITRAENILPDLRSDPTIQQTLVMVSRLMKIIKAMDLKMVEPAGLYC